MRWRLSPLRQRRLYQLLFCTRLTGYRRRGALAGLLLLLTIAVVGRGLYAPGGPPASGSLSSNTPWGHYAATLRPASGGGHAPGGGVEAGAVGGEVPPDMAGVTVEADEAGSNVEEPGGRTLEGGARAKEGAVGGVGEGVADERREAATPVAVPGGAPDGAAADGGDASGGAAPVSGAAGAEGGDATAPGGGLGNEAAGTLGGASRSEPPAGGGLAGDQTVAPGGPSGAGAAEKEAPPPADLSAQPLTVQPGTIFDRIYLVTETACAARHNWINAMAAAAGVQSPVEMFPLVVNASDVDLRNPPLPVADVDPETAPTVTAADVALTATHRALWRRVFDDQHARVMVLSDTWFPSRSLLELLPELLKAVEAGASPNGAWHLLLLTRVVPPKGTPETSWTDPDVSAALNRTVTVVPAGGASAVDLGYILSAAGANQLLAGLTVHRAPVGTAMVNLPAVTTLSGCDNAHFLQGCPENGGSAPPAVVDACAATGATLPAAAFPNRAEANRVAPPMVLPTMNGEETKAQR